MSKIYYTKDHEWVSIEGDTATIGITSYAQEQLGDLVFIELPDLGKQVERGDAVVVVESVKAASDVYAPLSGKIVAVNEELDANPALVNEAPEHQGWLWQMQIGNLDEQKDLLDSEEYKQLL